MTNDTKNLHRAINNSNLVLS